MKVFGPLLSLAVLLISSSSFATPPENGEEGWIVVYGKDRPGSGYADDCKIEEGKMVNNRKEGKWIKYHKNCNKPRLIGHYKMGRPNGDYEKIDENGIVREKGTWNDGHQTGSLTLANEDGIIVTEKTFDEEGKLNGNVVMRYDDGSIQYEGVRVNGKAVGKEIYYYPNGDIKRIIEYNEDGTVKSNEERERTSPAKEIKKSAPVITPPAPRDLVRKDGKPMEPNGYNKLYNSNDELEQDGKFKDGKLWEGRILVYDDNGLLEKIEKYKGGKYQADEQLKDE